MAVREITVVGNPILREPTRRVDPGRIADAEIQGLIDDLIDTRREANGAGIAANQIGSNLRIAIAEVDGVNPRYPYKPEIPRTVMVNPEIEAVGDEMFENNEGCLSVPDLRGNVMRHVAVRVRYLDRDGNEHDEIKRGLTAGTFQHEIDHLDGRLFLDRVEDPATLATWDEFEKHQRDDFVARITRFVERIGS